MEYDRFIEWMGKELDRRGWIQADFARESGLSTATVSNVLSGKERPGLRFIEGALRAFGYGVADAMFVEIGLRAPEPEETANLREANLRFSQLSGDAQKMILIQMRALAEQERDARVAIQAS